VKTTNKLSLTKSVNNVTYMKSINNLPQLKYQQTDTLGVSACYVGR